MAQRPRIDPGGAGGYRRPVTRIRFNDDEKEDTMARARGRAAPRKITPADRPQEDKPTPPPVPAGPSAPPVPSPYANRTQTATPYYNPVTGMDYTAQGGGPPTGRYNPSGSDLYGPRESDPFTGFASRYTPMGAGQIWADPTIVFQDIMRDRGVPLAPGSGFMDAAQQIGALVPYLNMLMANAPGETGDEAGINFMAELFRQMSSRGGRAPDAGFLLDQILDPNAITALSLYGGPGAGLPVDQQINALTDFATAALFGVNPLVQRAVVNAVQGAGQGYRGALARGDLETGANPFLDYIRQQNVIPTGFF